MYVFSCAPSWEAMLTCIYTAWASKLGQQNIRLEVEPIEQYTLFDKYEHVEPDIEKAERVMEAVNLKISTYVYRELAYCSMSWEPDTLDNIYRVMLLGFAYGPHVLDMVQYEAVTRNREIRTRVGRESCRLKESVRFHQVRNTLYVAHLEPKSRILVSLAPYFQDRMPSEYWMIVDDAHFEAVIHPKNEDFYVKKLTGEEMNLLLETEKHNDEYTDMWKIFFDTIAIKERENYRCQRNHFPLWTRKHAVEFMA